jgi:hypothetical protein
MYILGIVQRPCNVTQPESDFEPCLSEMFCLMVITLRSVDVYHIAQPVPEIEDLNSSEAAGLCVLGYSKRIHP